jgi:hypothetical protein
MSISWINIFIKKQHNTTRVITLQTRTTHAPSTTNPETGGFLHKKLTATEETGDTESHTATATRSEFKTNTNTQAEEALPLINGPIHSSTRKEKRRPEPKTGRSKDPQALVQENPRPGAVISDRDQGQQCFNIKRTKERADSVLRRHFTQAYLESQASPSVSEGLLADHPNCGPSKDDVWFLDTVRIPCSSN